MLNSNGITKPLGGWNFQAKRYEVLAPDPRFPPVGTVMAAWPWGDIIHRVEQTGKHVTVGELADLVTEGKLRPVVKQTVKQPT